MWKFALSNEIKNPESLVFTNERLAVIKDKFPKSEFHYLVLPVKRLADIGSVKAEHVDLLREMELLGRRIAREKCPQRKFKFGFHAEPSMDWLHMHVISDDFISDRLKNKKHWNSFNTSFFIPSSEVIRDLESAGKVILPSKKQCELYLKTPLKCHKCSEMPKTMPQLKLHLESHSEGT